MREAQLIEELTKFITQNNFNDSIKSFEMSSSYGELKLSIVFNTKVLKDKKPEVEPVVIQEKKVKVPPVVATPQVEVVKEEPKETSLTEIASGASAAAIDAANEKYIAEDGDLKDAGINPEEYYKAFEKRDKEQKAITPKPADGTKTLYNEREFTSDEITYISSYLKGECTGKEASELLGYGLTKFNSLVSRYKRAKNIKVGKKELVKKQKAQQEGKKENYTESRLPDKITTFDYSIIDMDKVYRDVMMHGDSVSAIARDYGCAQGTLNYKLRNYAKEHDLPLEFPNHSGGRKKKEEAKVDDRGTRVANTITLGISRAELEEELGIDRLEREKASKETKAIKPEPIKITKDHTKQEKESIEAYNRAISLKGKKVNLEDGWQKLEDGSLHLIKAGIVVR